MKTAINTATAQLQAELAGRGLPEIVFVEGKRLGIESRVVGIKRGETGYYPIRTEALVSDLNDPSVTQAQVDAMVAGSMFGWHVPGAFPAVYEGRQAERDAVHSRISMSNAANVE